MRTNPIPVQQPGLAPPILARGVDRDDNAPVTAAAGPGVEAARADCRKLRGPARDMCFKAQANRR